jgi:hypothetical protein
MTDIVDELRAWSRGYDRECSVIDRGADEIERLRRLTWYACSERLPTQDGEESLVCGNDTSPPWYAVAAFNAERGCFEDDTIGISPTHWMPLPAAPEVQK